MTIPAVSIDGCRYAAKIGRGKLDAKRLEMCRLRQPRESAKRRAWRLESPGVLPQNDAGLGPEAVDSFGPSTGRPCGTSNRECHVSLIDRAERLKKELTDKWVVVSSTAPELKRFASLTGKVKTVNMNCRALVEFDNGIDISWYDIDPGFLTVVDSPKPKKSAAEAKPAKAAPAADKPAAAAAPAGGGSPLDKIRAAAGGAKPAAAAPAAGGSPLDKIRAAAGGAKPAAAPAPAAGGSPLDKIRAAQAKPAAAAPAATPAAETPAPEAPAAEAPKPKAPAAPLTGSPLDRIRAQGAAKKE